MKGALIAGTLLSMAVTGAWSVMAAATIGDAPAGSLSFWHHPSPASYWALAVGATGNAAEFSAVVAVIYALCFLFAGWRRRSRAQVQGGVQQ